MHFLSWLSKQGGNSCYCGASNWVSRYGKLQETQCSTSCVQTSNQLCGNSVYLCNNKVKPAIISQSELNYECKFVLYCQLA